MYYKVVNHEYINELQSITQIFFPIEGFVKAEEIPDTDIYIYSEQINDEIITRLYKNGLKLEESILRIPAETDKHTKNIIQKGAYKVCAAVTGIEAPWGILVGIRPTKIINELWASGMSDDQVRTYFKDFYWASKGKTELCIKGAKAEEDILKNTPENSIGLYIGIPFCLSRCLYCSFSAYTVKQYKNRIDEYLEALFKELSWVREYAADKRLQTIYVGGGTPTAIEDYFFSLLMEKISEILDISAVEEFTVEAGRPDSLSPEKFKAMKNAGVSRISVNPQTLNNETLKIIGRSHTAEDFYHAYNAARQYGFNNINTDLIMGLPGESLYHCEKTMEGILKLKPESVTVHTLAVKRASPLKEQKDDFVFTDTKVLGGMLDTAQRLCMESGLNPYYMYRQKNILGNYENVGYCSSGREGIYNVQIIEEKQTIVAVGAGAATKHVDRNRNLVRRIYNVKSPEGYISRIDEMIERKKKLYLFDEELAIKT